MKMIDMLYATVSYTCCLTMVLYIIMFIPTNQQMVFNTINEKCFGICECDKL